MIKQLLKTLPVASLFLASTLFAQNFTSEFTWTQESEKRMSWDNAKKFCSSKGEVLPSKAQFKKLWKENGKNADLTGFDNSVSYWTSTVEKTNYLAAYPFYFGDGREDWYYKADHYGVRCIKKK